MFFKIRSEKQCCASTDKRYRKHRIIFFARCFEWMIFVLKEYMVVLSVVIENKKKRDLKC